MTRAIETRRSHIPWAVRIVNFCYRYLTELKFAAIAYGLWNGIALYFATANYLHLPNFFIFHVDPALMTNLSILTTAVVVASISDYRAKIVSDLMDSRARRGWLRIFAMIGGPLGAMPPHFVSTESRPFGSRIALRLRAGTCLADVERSCDLLATALHAKSVRAVAEGPDASHVALYCYTADPFAQVLPIYPSATVKPRSIWEPFALGLNENGQVESVTLTERNVLIGGEPGAGKSVALSVIVSHAALDPACSLYLLDGKVVELAAWRPAAEGYVGSNLKEAVELLGEVGAEMAYRYETLLALGKRKVEPGMGLDPVVVVIDEMAHYLTHPDRPSRSAFAEVLRDLVSRGRAAGIIVVAATQKPASDTVPTSLRDLFSYRLAFRCSTKEASDTILGSGWASQGVSASDIDPKARGVGYLLHEGGVPVKVKSYLIDDAELVKTAERATQLRVSKRLEG